MTYLSSERNRYRLEETLLGEGGYGKVRKATCLATGEVYACKAVQATKDDFNPGLVSCFFAIIAAGLTNRQLVACSDADQPAPCRK